MKRICRSQAIVGAVLFMVCALPATAQAQAPGPLAPPAEPAPPFARPGFTPSPPAPSAATMQPPSPPPGGYAPPADFHPPPANPPPGGSPPAGAPPAAFAPPPGYAPPPECACPPGSTPSSPAETAAAEPKHEPSLFVGSVGFGMGVPYGVFGGAITLGFDYLALMAGFGSTIIAGAGYGFGARVYLVDSGHTWRPHLTAVWGTTGTYLYGDYSSASLVITGFGFYAGLDQDVGEPGGWYTTYGLGYITLGGHSTSGKDVPINAMIGVGYRFGGRLSSSEPMGDADSGN